MTCYSGSFARKRSQQPGDDLRAALAAMALAAATLSASAQAVHRIKDGDTFVLDDVTIRVWGIDAPDNVSIFDLVTFRGGKRQAREALARILATGPVQCVAKEMDRHKRTVAVCSTPAVADVGAEMVRQGYACDWKRFSSGAYDAQEREAKANMRGLWASGTPQAWRCFAG